MGGWRACANGEWSRYCGAVPSQSSPPAPHRNLSRCVCIRPIREHSATALAVWARCGNVGRGGLQPTAFERVHHPECLSRVPYPGRRSRLVEACLAFCSLSCLRWSSGTRVPNPSSRKPRHRAATPCSSGNFRKLPETALTPCSRFVRRLTMLCTARHRTATLLRLPAAWPQAECAEYSSDPQVPQALARMQL
jgi:hypothetical protein